MRKVLVLSIVLTLVLSCSAFAAGRRYVNGRFGFSFIVPAGMKAMPQPTNGDGRQFVNRQDKFEITGSGMFNAMEPLQTAYGYAAPEGKRTQIIAHGKNGTAKDVTLRWTEGRIMKWCRAILITTKDDPTGHFISVYAECPIANVKRHESAILTSLKSLRSTGGGIY